MKRSQTVVLFVVSSLLLLIVVSGAFAKDPAPPAPLAPPSSSELAAPPRVAIGPAGALIFALPVADGIEIVSTKDDLHREFGAPVRAVRQAGLMLGGRRGPRIAAAGATVVLAAVTMRHKENGGDLLTWRSSDGGLTWGDAVRVNDVPGCAAEGLFDLAALGDGRFVLVWLDSRKKGARLFADFSADGAKWAEDALAYESPDGSVCECCAPAVTAVPDGQAVVGFRNSLKGDRDIWTMLLASASTKFEKARKSGKGSWSIKACPMAGPAMVVRADEVVSVWRREQNVFLATGNAKERDLGVGTEPALVLREDGVHVLWISGDALLHLAPSAKAPETIATGAAFPSAVSPSDPKQPGVVTWFDVATRRARVAEVR